MSTPPPLPPSQPTAEPDPDIYSVAEPPPAATPQTAYPQQAYAQRGYYVPQAAVPLAYAAPSTGYGDTIAWSEGDVLVVRKGATLPPLCVRCNEPAEGDPIKRNFSWHHPAHFLLVLAGVLVYAIVALVVQKKGTVYVSLCARHRGRRLMMGVTSGALAFGGLAMLIFAGVIGRGWPALAGGAMLLVGLILAVANQTLTAKRIDDHFLWLRGTGRAFVANFPPTGRA